jgi:hypothetical protein
MAVVLSFWHGSQVVASFIVLLPTQQCPPQPQELSSKPTSKYQSHHYNQNLFLQPQSLTVVEKPPSWRMLLRKIGKGHYFDDQRSPSCEMLGSLTSSSLRIVLLPSKPC